MGTKILLTNTANILLLACRNTSSVFFTREASLWASDNTVKSPHKDIDIPSRTVPEHIWENLERWADKTAIMCGVTKRSYTYHQLYRYSRNFGTKLRTQLKIRESDVVCAMIPNSPEYPLISLGALEAGAIISTINPMYTPHEVERQITLSDAKVLIGFPETIPVLREALFLAKKSLPIITVKGSNSNIPPGTICFEELAFADNVDQSTLKYIDKTSEKVALLPYSSGTTGLPKGVELTHRNIVVNCVQQDVDTIRHYNETTKKHQDTTLAIMPFYHIYGLAIVLLHKLSIGSEIVTVPKFHPSTFINILKEHPMDIMYMAPALILFLGSHSEVTEKHLESVKTITSGGALLPLRDISKLLEKVKPGTDLLNLYGMTEASPLVTMMLPGGKNYKTVGFALPNTKLRIVNSSQQLLGPNEVGELQIFGPHVMKGYRSNVHATKDTITEDGWLKSGDLACIDKDGAVTIADRLKELIKVKGFQVPPAELENILKDHPNVFDVAVVGIPHEKMGEIPKAFIVLKEGQQVSAEEIMSFVDHKVVEYKRIKEVQFVDEIPRNPSGKILRKVIKEKYC